MSVIFLIIFLIIIIFIGIYFIFFKGNPVDVDVNSVEKESLQESPTSIALEEGDDIVNPEDYHNKMKEELKRYRSENKSSTKSKDFSKDSKEKIFDSDDDVEYDELEF